MSLDIFNTNSPAWMLDPKRNCHIDGEFTPAQVGAIANQWHPSPVHERQATRLCRGCPQMTACLKYALADPELDGIWGATTTAQRHAMRSSAVA